jgi:peptidoglycan/xylan/chitin deacetylase (PgdA/CDA1 family)
VRNLIARLAHRIRASRPRPLILMYHRVAAPRIDPWGLAVSPPHFEEQLDVLCRSRRPMPLATFVRRLGDDTLPSNAVAVTFDDGYVDNLHEAKPRLSKRGVPATLFLATGFVGQQREYWWDELARSILLRTEPLECDIGSTREPWRIALGKDTGVADPRTWRAWQEPRTDRENAYMAVWQRLRVMRSDDREQALRALRRAVTLSPADTRALPMTATEVRELVADGLVDLGGHTVTHPVLSGLSTAHCHYEIREGKLGCERLSNRPVQGFAYPHGAHDAGVRTVVKQCGFEWACSTEGRPVSRIDRDLYALPRLFVPDCGGAEFQQLLKAAGTN